MVSSNLSTKSGWFDAVVNLDPATPTVTPLLGTYKQQSDNGTLNNSGDAAWIVNEDRIFCYQASQLEQQPQQVFELPKDLVKGRKVFRLVTDLTRTCDGKFFVLDSWVGNQYHVGIVELATGEYRTLGSFANDHSHTICSRHDPNLFLINQGHWIDPIAGHKTEMQLRIWLMSLDGSVYQPLDPELCFNRGSHACHEWWSPNGAVQYCNYDVGIMEQTNPFDPRSKQLIWDRPSVHGVLTMWSFSGV